MGRRSTVQQFIALPYALEREPPPSAGEELYAARARPERTTISGVLRLEAEIVAWDGGKKDYRHTHCLVLRAR
jgi:hypothetical protein